jgi:Na+-driven multidrug efflux pump
MRRIIDALSVLNYKLLLAIFFTMLLPTIYQTVRIHFLGDMPTDWGVNIASQLSWVNLVYEIIQEAIILPLFFILGKSIKNKDEIENKIKSGLLVTGIIYSIFSVIVFIFANQFVRLMAQNIELISTTATYIRLESIAIIFSALSRFLMLTFITLKKDKCMYIILLLQMTLSILFDILLISNLPISLGIGVNGIAISNLVVGAINLTVGIILLQKASIHIFSSKKMSFKWTKEWFQVGKFSGLESFVRNFVFMIMIIRMVNVISEQAVYWIANNFIWNWLLLPVLALSDLIKKDIGEDKENIKNNTMGYLILSVVFIICWIAGIPLWKLFLYYVMNVSEYETVYYIVYIQTIFYIVFIVNNVFDSTFYGIGRTDYMLIQSLVVNIFYYGGAFILYINGIFIPSLLSISLLFGIGMLIDFIPTIILYIFTLKKFKYKII